MQEITGASYGDIEIKKAIYWDGIIERLLFDTFIPPVSTLIHDENFDSFANDVRTGFDGWTNVATTDNTGSNALRQWRTQTGTTATASTGPNTGNGGSGAYIFAESSGGNTEQWLFQLDSQTLDASNATYTLQFDYYAYFNNGTGLGDLTIEGFNGTSFIPLGVIEGQQQTSGDLAWLEDQEFSSLGFTNTDFKFRIQYRKTTVTPFHQDAALDNLRITRITGSVSGGGDTGVDKDPRFVVMGASIMNESFSNPLSIQNEINTALGSDIILEKIAVDGGRLQTLSERVESDLDLIIPILDRTTYCVFHIGGNDMNILRPYSDDVIEDYEVFTEYWDIIINAVEARGFIPIIGNISYRTYEGSASPDVTTEDTGSQPYNSKLWIPDANKYTPDFVHPSGMPFFQMYETMYEGGDAQDVAANTYMYDGVHPTSLGATKIQEMFRDQVVQPILTGTPAIQKALANGRPHEAVVSLGVVTGTTAVINWKPVFDPDGILKYEIYKDGIYDGEVLGNVNTYTLTGLNNEDKYRIHVIAEDNNNQRSYESNDVYAVTDAANGAKLISYLDINKRLTPTTPQRLKLWSNTGAGNFLANRNTATTTPNTGPNFGPDANGVQQTGLKFLFIETTGGGVDGTSSSVETSNIDASDKDLYLKFMYHMFFDNDAVNQSANYLKVDCWNGTAWIEEFRVTGQQHTADSDFTIQTIDASAYTNVDFKFRISINFVGTLRNGWRDTAWARPKIFNGNPN